jgi:Flp pilus assembly protein TadG
MGPRLTALADDETGSTTTELAMLLPVLLMLLFGLLQLGVLGMVSADFNNAVLGVSRQIRTGQSDGPKDAHDFAAKICARMIDPADCARRLTTSVIALPDFAGAGALAGSTPADLTKGQMFDAGAAGTIILVTATYRWPLAIPFAESAFPRADGVNVLIVSRLVFKNEPYGP